MGAWAIIVGINEYPTPTGLRTLHGAVADAVDFADWLLDPEGGSVDPSHLFLWTCPKPDPATCTQRVSDYLDNQAPWPLTGPDFTRAPLWAELVANVDQINAGATDDQAERLYIFFAGHGVQIKPQSIQDTTQNCFVLGDYYKGVGGSGLINCDVMRRYLERQGPKEVLIFLDCCRTQLPDSTLPPGAGFGNYASTGAHERMFVARAAQNEKLAFEVPIGPNPERGAFTQLLTYGLREIRKDGKLTLRELDDYVTKALEVVVSKPLEQVPDFEELPKPPKLILATSPPKGLPARIRIALPGVQAGSQVELRNNEDVVVQKLVGSDQPVSVMLPLGGYSLEQNGAVLKAFQHVGPGAPDVVV